MCSARDDWGFGPWFGGARWWGHGPGPRGSRRRNQMFESGEVKFVILRLLKEKPRHGYEVIKALEEKMGGYYTPSAGTVYPTLQLLEDEGYVRAVEDQNWKIAGLGGGDGPGEPPELAGITLYHNQVRAAVATDPPLPLMRSNTLGRGLTAR